MTGDLCVLCDVGAGMHETEAWNGVPSPVCDGCIGGPVVPWDQGAFVWTHVCWGLVAAGWLLQVVGGGGVLQLTVLGLPLCWGLRVLARMWGVRRASLAWRRI